MVGDFWPVGYFWTQHFTGLQVHFFRNIGKCMYILSDAILLLAKLLPESEGWGRIWKSITSGQASNYPDVRW